jgi:hypothetical protein
MLGISFFKAIRKRFLERKMVYVNVYLVQHLDQIIMNNTGNVNHPINNTDYERGREVEDS